MAENFKFVQAQNFSLNGAGQVIGDTSVTLKTFTTIDGALLTMSNFGTIGFGTLSPGNGTLEEQICFTGVTQNTNGTATLTGVSSVTFIYPYTQTSGLLKTHAGSTPFIISNTSGFYNELTSINDDETINGDWTFTNFAPTIPTQLSSDIHRAASIEYVNAIAIAGAPDAATNVLGIAKISVNPVSAVNPIAVGDNDPRVPTLTEAQALPGTVGTPGSGNLYVTNLDTTTAIVASSIVRRLPSTGDIAVPTTPGAAGDAASKSYVDGGTYRIFTSGTNSYSSSSGTQTIAHGLGRIPKKIKITAAGQSINVYLDSSIGTYNGTTTSTLCWNINTSGAGSGLSVDSVNIVNLPLINNSAGSYTAIATFDATNIYLAWVLGGSGATAVFMWEAE